MPRNYDALVLDIDGTLLDEQGRMHTRTKKALARARAEGVVVMLATGRSHWGCRDVVDGLGLEAPSVVLNGAAVYSRQEDRLIEHYAIPEEFVEDLIAFATRAQLLPVLSCLTAQYTREPLEGERKLLTGFRHLERVKTHELPRRDVVRLTFFSRTHESSDALHAEVLRTAGDRPAYFTHFPLSALPGFRSSLAQVVDVQPACDGKAEAMRVLAQRYAIPAERVVAVGDANNDLPMLKAAGMGVAMGNATLEAKAAAKRVIGHNDSDALGQLVEELFLGQA
jgi:Cof subfamily protein (haloacid dehalogenase superfamily)